MLQIFINKQGLDLPSDIALSIIYSNPLFETDRIPTPGTLDFNVPKSQRNIEALGHPERINGLRSAIKMPARVLFSGVTLLIGEAIVDSVDENINLSISGAVLPDDIKKQLRKQPLAAWDLTPSAGSNPVEGDSPKYNELLVANIKNSNFPIVAAPVAVKDSADPDESTTTINERYKALRQNYISPYNTASNNYLFRAGSGRESLAANILPAIRIHYLFQTILGDRLKKNVFKLDEWPKLVMLSTYHPDFTIDGSGAPLRRVGGTSSLRLEDLVPAMTANEFISELLKIPCATLYLKGENYYIEFNSDIINRDVTHNWSDKIIGTTTTSTELGMNYKFAYSNELPSEIPPFLFSAKSISQMLEIGYSGYVQIWSPLQTFNCTPIDDTMSRFGYTVINYGTNPEKQEEQDPDDTASPSDYDMQTKAEVLINNLRQYTTSYDDGSEKLPDRYLFLPEIDPIEAKRNDKILLTLYHGLKNDASRESRTRTYPYLCSSCYDTLGQKIGNLSLDRDKVYQTYHKPFAEWLARDRVTLSAELRLSILDLSNLDLRDKFNILGRNFLIKELQATISINRIESCEADFVEV